MNRLTVLLGVLFLAAPPARGQDQAPQAPEGFAVELLYTVPREQGSWVAMTFDPAGRLIVSPQEGPLYRLSLRKDQTAPSVEKISAGVGDAQGLLYAHGSLYVNGKGPGGPGFYRLRDRDHDGTFGDVALLRRWPLEMTEHGPHGIVLGPDGKLYIVNGNYTKVPQDLSPRSPHRHYAEDLLLPRQWDATGHAVGLLAPGGVVLRTDPDGKDWELFCGGLRNAYDLAFSPEGELFTFDSDMERDLGSPWYRPTRILHLVSGAEYGWRSGTGKWPASHADSLPAAVDVGRSSPTGLAFGTGSRFSEPWRSALFAADWAFGRIFAVHLKARGATYEASFEPFVTGQPMNVTDLEFGPDGSMYFITGGRGTESRLYRVSQVGAPARDAAARPRADGAEARARRRRLEALHAAPEPGALEALWPSLEDPDRWIRTAARIALERQPVPEWRGRARNGPLEALLALARVGAAEDLPPIVERLGALPWKTLPEEQKLAALRIYQVAFLRLGPADAELRSRARAALDPRYPAGSFALDRELSQLLVYLEAEGAVRRTVQLLGDARIQEEQMHYAFVLRVARQGWSASDRERYFRWFGSFSDYRGDIGFPLFLRNVRSDALRTLSAQERAALQPLLETQFRKDSSVFQRATEVVKAWTFADLWPDLEKPGGRRNFTRGKAAFAKAQCLACHSMAGEGGALGPDLTGVRKRLGRRDLLEAILFPSKDVSDQYKNTMVQTESGDVIVGRKIDEDADRIVLLTDPLADERAEIPRKRIRGVKLSALSPMPEGLLHPLTKFEILDLFAYLESDGKEE
jgi:putative heme-binding domain-containing protein